LSTSRDKSKNLDLSRFFSNPLQVLEISNNFTIKQLLINDII
jgi:hypothetical protein